MKRLLILLSLFTVCYNSKAQQKHQVFTSDIAHFWTAYDSIVRTDSESEKLRFLNTYYLSKESDGLREFRKMLGYTDSSYVEILAMFPHLFESIRTNTHKLLNQRGAIDSAFLTFERLYPEMKDTEIYFTVGCLGSGGKPHGNMILLGTEILAADSTTNVSELHSPYLENHVKTQTVENIAFFIVHEYVHTLQKGSAKTVLSACIQEGACDFIAELATGKPLDTPYLRYGRKHYDDVKEQFVKDMLTTNVSSWLFNAHNKGEAGDLGYFIGYEISKLYHQNSTDKTQAIKDIIELDFGDDEAVVTFLENSTFLNR